MEISGKEYADAIAWGWGESAQFMGPNVADNASGVFWGAFACLQLQQHPLCLDL